MTQREPNTPKIAATGRVTGPALQAYHQGMSNQRKVIDATMTIYPDGTFNVQNDCVVKLTMVDSIPVSRVVRLVAAVPISGGEEHISVPMPEGHEEMSDHDLLMACFSEARKTPKFRVAMDEARSSQ